VPANSAAGRAGGRVYLLGMTPAAIFARVSKKDAQDTANHLALLHQWAAGRGF
jgi:hypothetical protein